jgi:hypothetical protein
MKYTKEQLLNFAKFCGSQTVPDGSGGSIEDLFSVWEYNQSLGEVPYTPPKGDSNEPPFDFDDIEMPIGGEL